MDNVLHYLRDQGFTVSKVDHAINHEEIKRQQERKGYVPRHKKYTVNLLKSVPNRAGVYMFSDGHRLIYVGKSANLRDRIRQHISAHSNTKSIRHRFYSIYYIRCMEYVAKEIEYNLIQNFKPYGNIQGVR